MIRDVTQVLRDLHRSFFAPRMASGFLLDAKV